MSRLVMSVLACAVVVTACGNEPDATKAAPQASVSKKVNESELVKVTLTAEAEARLGIALGEVVSRKVPRRRTTAAEIVVPSGGALQLTAPVAATVPRTAKLATIGAPVRRGDALVTLVPLAPVDRDLRAQSERAATSAETRLAAAQAKLDRAEKLLADGAGSARAVEEARAERDVAKAELDAASSRRTAIGAQPLSADMEVVVRAPHEGVVQKLGVSPGQMVAPGALLVEVVGTSALWVRVPLFVTEARSVRLDAPARILPLSPSGRGAALAIGEALPAHAPPAADPTTSTTDLVYELAAGHGLRPGERVLAEVPLQGDEDRLVVPRSAIAYDVNGGAWMYEAAGDHAFLRRRVGVERVDADDVVLERGGRQGTRVVKTGVAELWGVEFGVGK